MANDTRCVFCGKSISPFRSTNVLCGKTHEPSCRDCAREMESLPHTERCRRALQRGLANRPELLREYIEVTQSAEDHRPTCGCGGKLRFMEEQNFDNPPTATAFSTTASPCSPATVPPAAALPSSIRKPSAAIPSSPT